MAFFSGSRINTNVGARNALDALNSINARVGQQQLKLATGKRINSVSDDAAGYTISTKISSRTRGLSKALGNIGEAKNILAVAESGYQAINDILLTVKEKVIQAGNASYQTEEKNALAAEIQQLAGEVDRIVAETKFNGLNLIDGTGLSNAIFQVGADSGDSLTLSLSQNVESNDLQINNVSVASLSQASIGGFISSLETSIGSVSSTLQTLGSYVNRLDTKETVVTNAITNLKAAKSRIVDADLAQEQLESSKLQILQQTATTQLAQANATPQNVLSLFR
jgi:flagellin